MSRRIALRILVRVEKEGLFAAPLLDRYLERSDLSPLDKGLTTELVYGVLRWQGRLDGILSSCLRYPLHKMDSALRCILRLGAYQILFLDRIPAFAAAASPKEIRNARLSTGQPVQSRLIPHFMNLHFTIRRPLVRSTNSSAAHSVMQSLMSDNIPASIARC